MIPTSKFTYNETARAFIADASDLGASFVLRQIYPDACDVGVTLCSARTGLAVDYVLSETITREGETCAWKLVPTTESARRVPRCRGTHVLIVND